MAAFSREGHTQLGLPRGGGLGTTVQALVDRGELTESQGTRSVYRVIDPLFARWVREGRDGGLRAYVAQFVLP